MPEKEYGCLAIADGDNIVSGIQRLGCGTIDIGKFTAFIRQHLLLGSALNPLMIWCQTLLSSDPEFPSRKIELERHEWRVHTLSGAIETDEHTGCQYWSGMPDSFIAQEARKALTAYRVSRLLLASGDGYFIPLINQAKEHLIHTIVLSDRKSLHHNLYAVANEVIEIEKHIDEITNRYTTGSSGITAWRRNAQRLEDSSRPLIKRRRLRRRR